MSSKNINDWPIYFKDKLIVSNLNSTIAIATLWTPKELIKNKLNDEDYLIIGQLYTKKGINYLIRNILAKPQVKYLILVGNDLMGSGTGIKTFFDKGIDDDFRVIGDDFYIEKEINRDSIDKLRSNVQLIDHIGINDIKNIKNIVNEANTLAITNNDQEQTQPVLWAKPKIFDDPPMPEISRFPAEIDLTKIRSATIADAYISVLKHINNFGLESQPVINYVSDTSSKLKEMLNLTVVITDEDAQNWHIPEYFPFTEKDLEKYFDGFFDYDKHTEDYTYGERLFNYAHDEINELKEIYPWLKIGRFQKFFEYGGINQVEISIIRKLSKFPYDKGAIALLGNTFTDVFPQRPPKKIPCLFLIQAQIFQENLQLTAYFRSNDMYNAWPLNAFALRKLQFYIAEKLNVGVGNLITISNMAHIYEHNFSDVAKILEKNDRPNCEWDPRGNFHVFVENNDVVVKLATPRGNEYIKEWRVNANEKKAANKLCFEIIDRDLSVSVMGNAADLARQIERAVIAVRLKIPFEQDNELDLSKFNR